MFHWRNLAVLLLVGFLVVSAGTAFAKPGHGKGKITWTPGRVEQVVEPGQTVTVKASFVSPVDLTHVTFRLSGGLSRIVSIEPASLATVKAGSTQTITLTITQPTEKAHNQGGVMQVRVGQRNQPHSLKIKITVPSPGEDEDKDDDDEDKD
ncbi:MAG: hypothetical protein BroJett011_46890 [Chloroflexota bacterium]|nr:MAG: hypothetical protein BroJett011_46890 [Chloroflexota bacterium]